MTSTIVCKGCGASFEEAIGPCSHYGGELELSVPLTGVKAIANLGRLGAVADEPIEEHGERVRYLAPSGARSESALVGDRIYVQVEPPVDIGTRGEPRVFDRIVAVLSANGTAPVVLPHSDRDGQDRVVRYGGDEITIQIVSAGPGPGFWQDVAMGSGHTQGDLHVAVAWVHNAIVDKTKMYSAAHRRSMLLAVDISHLGVLSSSTFVAAYLRTHENPGESGFGAVWLVGPTDSRCTCFGTSRW